ncbi:MAG TPA: polyphosphate:AMP phosphotransferase [Phycisphaerae bacterium]|nr:polyphosphate:AMP phosphotransferase [Phycisphaerae bacterium]
MFETAEIGQKMAKEEYKQRVPELRTQLVQMQVRLRNFRFPVIVVVEGDDRPGVDGVINFLNSWLDPRFVHTHAFGDPSDEERERPRFWRYWQALAPRGQIGVYSSEWTTSLIVDLFFGRIGLHEAAERTEQIRRFEKALADDGAVIVKFWLHLRRGDLKKRLQKAAKRPEESWKIREVDELLCKHYRRVMGLAEEVLRKTNSKEGAWHLVESRCERYRDVVIAETLQQAVRERMEACQPAPQPKLAEAAELATPGTAEKVSILSTVDLSAKLDDVEYDKQILTEQGRLYKLAAKARRRGRAAVILFEGWDAAGKGGAIRRLAQSLNAQMYRIVPIAAPTEEERRYHYLWRFWRHIPRDGRFTIFDRTWYGRVLVERVEGFASEDEWRRGYDEIVDFEEQLINHGLAVLKFWLHIDRDEQMRRFKDREQTPFKQFKITGEDYHNREKWPSYEVAVNEMVAHTSTVKAPWHLIPSNDKKYARVQILRRMADGLATVL